MKKLESKTSNMNFKTAVFVFLALITLDSSAAKKPKDNYVKIKTEYGEVIVRLYNETPKHSINFLKLVKDGTLNGTLFHRVIKDFMIQGGDPDSKNAKPEQLLGEGDLGYKIDAEFLPNLFHKKGVLAAARDNNPNMASSASQFYLVQGKIYTDEELNAVEQGRLKGKKIPAEQRNIYKTIGGTPFLDQSYTVFGEIITSLQMIDKIADLKVNSSNRPLTDVKAEFSIPKKKEIKKILKVNKNL